MKNSWILMLCSCFIFFGFQCEKTEEKDIEPRPVVEAFLKQILEEKNAKDTFPDFIPEDIEILLYSDLNFEERMVNYPSAHLFGWYPPPPPFTGEYILWTIEWIRIKDDLHPLRTIPSYNPKILHVNTDRGEYVLPSESELHHVLSFYRDWWAKSETLSWSELRQINPLEGTDYYWG